MTPLNRRAFTVLLAVALAFPAGAAQKARPKPAADPTPERIEAILNDPGAWRAHWGIKVVSLDTGRVVYSLNEQKYFTPASNTKLFTTALALMTLGPDYRFNTTVEAAAMPDVHGRVDGNLYLVGRGDPNLSARVLPYNIKSEREGAPLRVLDALADQLAARGIRYVEGDLVADDTWFVLERFGEGWAVDDMIWSYGAPVSALSINDNVLFVDILPGEKPGDRALVKIEPAPGADYYRIENRIFTDAPRGGAAAAGANATQPRRLLFNREPGSYTLELWGRIPADNRPVHQEVALEDPALFAGQYLREALRARGIVVYGRVRAEHLMPAQFVDLRTGERVEPAVAAAQPERKILARHDSLPLSEDLRVTNKVSQNLHAEILLRAVARERRGLGSVLAGLEEMSAFLERAGVKPDDYDFSDGSGLSRRNLVTPAAIVALLQFMDSTPHRDLWRSTLPVAGVDGTIRTRFQDTPSAGRIQAKTGTLSHVNALSGYLTRKSGERLVFSIMLNHHKMRGRESTNLVDRICRLLVEN